MNFRHFIVFGILLAAGFAGGWMLITRESEIALIRFRDKDFSSALDQYERRLKSGDFSISVVMPLCQLYLQYGNVEAAIALMERFVRENPSNEDARRQLARYYQFSQRPDDYLRTLEELAASSPSEKTLRDLADIYNFRGEYERQIAILRTLVEKYSGQAEDFLALANLHAAQRQFDEAQKTMAEFESRHPQSINADTVQFMVSILLDLKQPEEAVRRAGQWLEKDRNPDTAARLSSLLNFKGEPQKALGLILPFEAAADFNPPFLSELIQLLIVNMEEERALARLDRLFEAGRLPDLVLERYLDLLLARKNVARAVEVAEPRDLSILPAWLLSSLAAAAISENRAAFVSQMIDSLGESFLEEFPVLGARLALVRGESAQAAAWIAKAEVRELKLDDRLGLSAIYNEVGRPADAIRVLSQLAENPQTPVSAMEDLANLYLDTGNAASGLPLFRRLKMRRGAPEIDRSWALLETKAGEEKPVIDWLKAARESFLNDTFLENIYFVAGDTGKPAVAALSAERLFARRGDDAARLRLANALSAAGRPLEALPHFRLLVAKRDPEIEAAYADALNKAANAGAPVRDEMRDFWLRKLRETPLDDKKREEAAQILLDLDDYEAILPVLGDLARRSGGTWLFAYVESAVRAKRSAEAAAFLKTELDRNDLPEPERITRLQLLREHGLPADALPYLLEFAEGHGGEWAAAYEESLEKLGRRDELVRFWRSRLGRAGLPPEEKRGIAFRALDLDEKNLAENVFRDLADKASAGSPDVLQLLFLWGPRPKPEALDWLENRARAAAGAERDLWIDHLVNVGAARRAIEVGTNGAVTDAYLRALSAAADARGMADAIGRKLATTSDPAEIRRLGRHALEMNLPADVRRTFTKLLSLAPDDPEALRRIGNLDYVESRFPEAEAKLSRYLSLTAGDYESHFYYAELLERNGSRGKAREHFQRSIEQIEKETRKTFQMRTIRALVLHRLGRVKDSISEFEVLIGEQPGNTHLRADYATVLIQAGRHDDARRLLGLP